ncbi:MAG: QueT transporter family protein [Eubacteriaceae bacterium]|nr:QueT transporter family protein [Eubacteriaceae bacterium]
MKIKYVMQAAIIAAIYAVITIVLSPISYGPMQIRVSEALTILPVFTSAGIPGLFVGCIISNLMGPYGLVDIVCGSAATLIAAFFTYKLRNKPVLAPLPPVIANGIIIGAELHYAYGVPGLWACMGWVALGELLACYALGFPLIKLLQKYKGIFR